MPHIVTVYQPVSAKWLARSECWDRRRGASSIFNARSVSLKRSSTFADRLTGDANL
jgi:hypothetical protein